MPESVARFIHVTLVLIIALVMNCVQADSIDELENRMTELECCVHDLDRHK